MKDIKYRAWDKKSKKMRYVNCIVFDGKGSFESNTQSIKLVNLWGYDIIEGKNIIVQREPKDVDLLQYTGLKDKNGTGIYDQYILKRTVTVVVFGSGHPPEDVIEYLKVEYREDYAGFYIGEDPLDNFVGARYDVATGCDCTDVEVIGNAFQHSHLLEGVTS